MKINVKEKATQKYGWSLTNQQGMVRGSHRREPEGYEATV